jgi:hypothetical protein
VEKNTLHFFPNASHFHITLYVYPYSYWNNATAIQKCEGSESVFTYSSMNKTEGYESTTRKDASEAIQQLVHGERKYLSYK